MGVAECANKKLSFDFVIAKPDEKFPKLSPFTHVETENDKGKSWSTPVSNLDKEAFFKIKSDDKTLVASDWGKIAKIKDSGTKKSKYIVDTFDLKTETNTESRCGECNGTGTRLGKQKENGWTEKKTSSHSSPKLCALCHGSGLPVKQNEIVKELAKEAVKKATELGKVYTDAIKNGACSNKSEKPKDYTLYKRSWIQNTKHSLFEEDDKFKLEFYDKKEGKKDKDFRNRQKYYYTHMNLNLLDIGLSGPKGGF